MENKNVGYLVLGISALIVVIIFLYRNALKEIIGASCGSLHGESCPMLVTVNQQTYLALAIVGVLVVLSLVLIFSKQSEKIVIKKVKEKEVKKKVDTSDLRPEDRKVLKLIQEGGAEFQADLIEKTGFGKAKMSRVIDRLEGRGLVERKRRGMTNVVVEKD
jgi:uncharacterized membrane protein